MEIFDEAKFNPTELDKLRTPEGRVSYLLTKGYKKIKTSVGTGSSRFTVAIDSKRALKLALNDAGKEQNKQEAESLQSIKSSLLPKFYQASKDWNWILVELARPFNDEYEFESKTGFMAPYVISFPVEQAVRFANNLNQYRQELEDDKFDFEGREEQIRALKSDLAKELFRLGKEHEINIADLGQVDQWGIAADGRIVVLDVGYNSAIANRHYKLADRHKLLTPAARMAIKHLDSKKPPIEEDLLKEYISLIIEQIKIA